jgi:hypothetical protein
MAAVLPCTAILGVRGLNLLMIKPFRENALIKNGVLFCVLFMTIRSPFKHEYFPLKFDNEQRLINEAGDWFKNSVYTKQKI